MIRNDVFVQRGIRAVKLRQLSVGAFLRTFVILLGDVIRGNPWVQKWMGARFERSLWEPGVLKVHEFFTELLSMEGKYAVKLSIPELIKISRK